MVATGRRQGDCGEGTGAGARRAESGRATDSPGGRFLRIAVPIGAIPALVFALVSYSWWIRCPASMHYTGYLQGDQPTYTAFANEVFERGNGLFYANPFDYDRDAPRVLTNLGYVVLGWLIRLAGGRDVLVWEIWRFGFGLACYGLYALIVARLFGSVRLRWWVYLAGVFGGGMAWVPTLFWFASRPAWDWHRAFVAAEEGYDFWCLNLSRQGLMPLELAYHALFFAAVLTYLDRRYVRLAIIVFICWWAHPVTAILVTTVVATALGFDWLVGRQRREAVALLSLLLVLVPWVVYYRVLLPSYPPVRSWIEQTLQFEHKLTVSVWPRAWGLLPLGLIGAAFYGPLRGYLARERTGRLILCWGLGALLWAHNDLFVRPVLGRAIQPMHFTRGYIFLFFLFLAAKWVELARGRVAGDLRRFRRLQVLAFGLLPLLAIDNALFVARMASEPPRVGLLTISRQAKQVLDFLRDQPGRLTILSVNPMLGVLIVAKTAHGVFLSERAITPFYVEREAVLHRMLTEPDVGLAADLGIDAALLIKMEGVYYPRWANDPNCFRIVFDNGLYQVGRIPGSDPADRGGRRPVSND